MTPGFHLYKMFNAYNLHFSKNAGYDYFKYNGSVKISYEKYDKGKFKWQFEALAKRLTENSVSPSLLMYRIFKLHEFKYIPLNAYNIKKMNGLIAVDKLSEAQVVREDMQKLFDKYKTNLSMLVECVDSIHPTLYNLFSVGEISIETLILYDSYIKRFLIPESSKDIILWPSELKKFDKIRGFVENIIPRDLYNDYIM